MSRRTRLLSPVTRAVPGELTMRTNLGRPGWSLPQARDLLRQGYTLAQVERLTGYPAQLLAPGTTAARGPSGVSLRTSPGPQ